MSEKSISQRFESFVQRKILPKAPTNFFNRRKVVFSAEIKLQDVSQLPYVSGRYYIRWDLKRGACTGQTKRVEIKNHLVTFDQTIVTECTMTLGPGTTETDELIHSDNVLQPCELVLIVVQEISGQTIELGKVRVNLAEFVNNSKSKRYLLQDSKVNSWLKVSAQLTWLKGETDYAVPVPHRVDSKNPLLGSMASLHLSPPVKSPSFKRKSVDELETDQISLRPSSISSQHSTSFTLPVDNPIPIQRAVSYPELSMSLASSELLDAPLYPQGPTARNLVKQIISTKSPQPEIQRWLLKDNPPPVIPNDLAIQREARLGKPLEPSNPWTSRVI